ncbi:MAG: ISLre2 family transposase, partial [Caldicoprobacterales bacterium]
GAAKMSRLIIYKKNGGKVYDLVMAQKRKHEIERREMQDQLVKEMRKLSESKYANSWNSKPTVITTGKKTALYNELRSIAGIRY